VVGVEGEVVVVEVVDTVDVLGAVERIVPVVAALVGEVAVVDPPPPPSLEPVRLERMDDDVFVLKKLRFGFRVLSFAPGVVGVSWLV